MKDYGALELYGNNRNKTHICVNNLAYVEHGTRLPV